MTSTTMPPAADRSGRPMSLRGLVLDLDRLPERMAAVVASSTGVVQGRSGPVRIAVVCEPGLARDVLTRPAGTTQGRGIAVLLNSHLLSEVELVCDRVVIISKGTAVAAGTPDELSRSTGVEVETAAGVRRFENATRVDVPRIVADLVRDGEQIYAVNVVRSTLEETYLEAIQNAEQA